MNAVNVTHRSARRHAIALLLGSALAAGGASAGAVYAPTAPELEHCLHQAGLELQLQERGLRLLDAQKFALGRERHMIALDTSTGTGRETLNPRLYCTVERDGRISRLQSMPRLPARHAGDRAMVVNY